MQLPDIIERTAITPSMISATDRHIYDRNAVIAANQWEQLRPTELCQIECGRNAMLPPSQTIAVGRLPDGLMSALKIVALEACAITRDTVLSLQQNRHDGIQGVNEVLRRLVGRNGEYAFHALAISNPDSLAVTRKLSSNGRYCGLHIDITGHMRTLDNACNAVNRLCINIGDEARFLVFVNLSVRQLLNVLVNEKCVGTSAVVANDLVTMFAAECPTYPVLRVRIDPYHYYIAPTDNFIHDGSTTGTQTMGIALHYLGRFRHFDAMVVGH